MGPTTYKNLVDRLLPRPVGLPREVQTNVELKRLRSNIKTLRESIAWFDAEEKSPGENDAEVRAKQERMPERSELSLPDQTASIFRELKPPLRGTERVMHANNHARAEQVYMRSIAMDVGVLKDSLAGSNMKTLPVLLKHIADTLESMHTINKELFELLKQKAPAQKSSAAPATDDPAGLEWVSKDEQIADLESELQESQFRANHWKSRQSDAKRTLQKRFKEYKKDVEGKEAGIARKNKEIARLKAQVNSKDEWSMRHRKESKSPSSRVIGDRVKRRGQETSKTTDGPSEAWGGWEPRKSPEPSNDWSRQDSNASWGDPARDKTDSSND